MSSSAGGDRGSRSGGAAAKRHDRIHVESAAEIESAQDSSACQIATAASRTELWLVRHGEGVGNETGVILGQKNVSLSMSGSRQARELGFFLRGRRFAAIYSSDLTRAADTARAIAETVALTVTEDAHLREVDVGYWSGLTVSEIAAQFPEEWAEWSRQPNPMLRRGGGESYHDLQRRIVPTLNNLAQRHNGEQVIVVSHGRTIAAYLAHLLRMPIREMWRLHPLPASITRVRPFATPEAGDTKPGRLVSFNVLTHLNTP